MTESITPFAPEAIEQLNEAFKDIYADCEPEANIIVKITGNSEPDDWPRWLAIAWNKPQMTLGSVYPAAVNDDFLLKMINLMAMSTKSERVTHWLGMGIRYLFRLGLR
jgi:hypothetical protein